MALPVGILPVPETLFYALIIGAGIGMLSIVFLILISLWTPAFTFIKAKMSKKPIFLMDGNDGIGGFYVPQTYENKFAMFKKMGVFGVIKNSHIFDRKSKQPIYITNKNIGATIGKEWPIILEQIQDIYKRKIRSGKDYRSIIEEAMRNPLDASKDPEIHLDGQTIRVSDLSKYFPYNINPTFIDEACMIAVRKDRRHTDTMKWMAGLAILFLVVGIAGYLLIGKANEKKSVCNCNFGDSIASVCSSINGGISGGGVQKVNNVNGTMQVIKEIKPNNANPKPGGVLS